MAYDHTLETLRTKLLVATAAPSTLTIPDLWDRYLKIYGYTNGTVLDRQAAMAKAINTPLQQFQLGRLFDPVSVVAGAQGAFYDVSLLTSLFQDTGGTTPVTAPGQSVLRVNDQSGNGNHLIAAGAGTAPTYQIDANGKATLLFDGVDDYMSVASLNLSASAAMSIVSGYTRSTNAVVVLAELSPDYEAAPGTFIHFWDGTGSVGLGGRGTAGTNIASTGARAVPETVVVAGDINLNGVDLATSVLNMKINGATGQFTNGGVAPGASNFVTQPLYVGARAGTSLFFSGRLHALAIRGGVMPPSQRRLLEQYIGSKTGVSL